MRERRKKIQRVIQIQKKKAEREEIEKRIRGGFVSEKEKNTARKRMKKRERERRVYIDRSID